MAERRTLVDGLKATPAVDPELEKSYVYRKPAAPVPAPAPAKTPNNAGSVARTALSTRMRADLAQALKRASLQRQLEGIEPSSLTEILEAAVEPWLRNNGYFD